MINQLDSSNFILQTIYKNIQIANLIQYYTQTPFPLLFNEFNSGSLENEEIKITEKDVCNNIQDKSLSSTCDEEKEKFLVRKEPDYFVSTDGKNNVYYYCFFKGCIKKYKSRENLYFHIQNVHFKKKPFKCKFCGKTFSHRNGYNYHLKHIHLLNTRRDRKALIKNNTQTIDIS
jgi:hypothetical protein